MALKSGKKWLTAGLVLLLMVAGLLYLPQCYAEIERFNINSSRTIVVDSAGNAAVEMTQTFNPLRWYDRIKQMIPNLNVWFRNIAPEPQQVEVRHDTRRAAYDDQKRAITYHADWLGLAVCRKERWEIRYGANENVITRDGGRIFTSAADTPNTNWAFLSSTAYILPAAATNVQVDPNRHLISYNLAPLKYPSGPAKPSVDLKFKPQLMSALYKIYAASDVQDGAYWVGKLVIKNNGVAPISDVRIQYKLGEFSAESLVQRYAQILPGGTVADLYYPIISARVTSLKTKTPVQLTVKYSYRDAAGRSHGDTLGERVDILGINQFNWSNLSEDEMSDSWYDHFNNCYLVAAFVTRMDDAVKQFAGYISEAGGGAAAALKDEDAIQWLGAAYDLQLANNIVYQTPSGYMTVAQSLIQEIKYPRDVFRDKSGTCIDLAITYAALAESVGLHANLLLTVGHSFAVIELPSGRFLPVENTGLGGGEHRLSFKEAVTVALKELEEISSKNKPYYLVDIEEALNVRGIPNPELPALSADFLDRCGIKRINDLRSQPPKPASQNPPPNQQRVLYSDDFSNPNSGWARQTVAAYGSDYKNGRYVINILEPNSWYLVSAPTTLNTSSYTMQADIDLDCVNAFGGLVFNLTAWDQPLALFLVAPNTRTFSVYQKSDEAWEALVDWTDSAAINPPGTPNRLRLEQSGGQVALYINDQYLTTVKINASNGPTKIGVGAGTGDHRPVAASFDNFLVTAK